jgi:hypothetical protein
VTHWTKFRQRWRQVALAALLLCGLLVFAHVAGAPYPLGRWLFWRYAIYWLCAACWAAACIGMGALTARRVLAIQLPMLELVAIAFPLGLLEFELVMFVAGLLQWYRTLLFFALPLAFLLLSEAELARAYRLLVRASKRLRRPLGALNIVAAAFGLLILGAIYFLILSPDNVQFDSRWKHLAIAEEFVAHGGLRRFGEGWSFGARPHLTSYVYAWAFLLPSSVLFDRIELCAHLEFTAFLITTWVGIPAIVRRLVPRADPRLVWVARCLFPGVLLYDSSLSVGADHFGAVLSVPLFLLTVRAWRDLSPRACALLGAFLAATIMVKETAALMLVPWPVLAIAVRAVLLAWKSRSETWVGSGKNWLWGPLAAALALFVVSSPFWLKNLVWYGDPLYPLLRGTFDSRPWTDESAYRLKWAYEDANVWHPARSLAGVLQTLKVLATFAFLPNDWDQFHGKLPVFGSLFSLLVPCLLFCRARARLWWLVAWIYAAIFVWYWVHHQDRYLQALMPLIAAATAAMMIHVWRAGAISAAALGFLVLFQIICGGDVYFFQTHPFARSVPKKSLDLFSASLSKDYSGRLSAQPDQQALAKLLPARARVLMHEQSIHLGIESESVSDAFPYQYGISYGSQRSAADVYELFRQLGVTHVFWQPGRSRGVDSLAGDMLFFDFALRRTRGAVRAGNGQLASMPPSPPTEPFKDWVAVFSCGAAYPSGLYRLPDLRIPVHGPKSRSFPRVPRAPLPADWPEHAAAASDFVAAGHACFKDAKLLQQQGFQFAAERARPGATRGQLFDIWIKTQ